MSVDAGLGLPVGCVCRTLWGEWVTVTARLGPVVVGRCADGSELIALVESFVP
jgi:hypothetical protein